MKRWMIICRVYGPVWAANKFIDKMKTQFPEGKFKLGEQKAKKTIYGLSVSVPIYYYSTLPHPNELTQRIVTYANSLVMEVNWKEPTPVNSQQPTP